MAETIEQKCLTKGVKLTDQRKIIARVMSQSHDHPDVDGLYNRVSKIDSKLRWLFCGPSVLPAPGRGKNKIAPAQGCLPFGFPGFPG